MAEEFYWRSEICMHELKLLWRGSVKENAEAVGVATEEIGLDVNADKTKYTVMPRE